VSSSADRSNAAPLAGRSVNGKVAIFVTGDTSVERISFYLDSVDRGWIATDHTVPFDMLNSRKGSSAPLFDTAQWSKGSHNLIAAITYKSGRRVETKVPFTVGSSGSTVTTVAPVTTVRPVTTTAAPTTTRPATTTTRPATTTTTRPATTTAAPTTTRPPTTTTRPATTTTAAPSTGSGPQGPSGTFRLHWSDEFNGTSLASHWNPNWLAGNRSTVTKPINGYEETCYDPANVSVRNGELVLKAEKRSCRASNGTTYPWASGMVESYSGFRWTYGYAEARIFVPADSNGKFLNWGAFWSNGNNHPVDGEIDIFEGINGSAEWNFHWSGGSNGGNATSAANVKANQWNTFGVLWEPGRLEFYMNGVRVGTQTQGVTSSSHYLILNNGVQTKQNWGYTNWPQGNSEMRVDWVRVWKRA